MTRAALGIVISEARGRRWRAQWPALLAVAADLLVWVAILAFVAFWTSADAEAAEPSVSAGASCPCQSAPRDSWTGQDKALHFGLGAAIAAGVGVHTGDPWKGFYAGAAAGVLKEALDATGTGQVSGRDLVVTVLGAAVGASGSKLVIGRRFIGVRTEF